MIRRAGPRIVVAALGALLVILAWAPPAMAHGIGGRVDLPVPRWLFVFGAASVLVVSFAMLGALWREPRLLATRRVVEPTWWRAILSSTFLGWVVRVLALGAFVVVTWASVLPRAASQTIGPVVVLIWFWVGLAFLQGLLGDWWATLSPFDTLGRLASLDYRDGRPPRDYPERIGLWPAAFGLFAFTWIELVDPFADRPGTLGILIVVYTLAQVAGMATFGRGRWLSSAEAFAVHLGLIARMAPVARDDAGRVYLRAPFVGLAGVEARPGLAAVVLVGLGTTTFDGLSRSSWWFGLTGGLTGGARIAAGTAGLVAVVLLVAGAYLLAMRAAAARGDLGWRAAAARFAPTLVPIVFAYLIAHYFSYLFIEGQLGIARISDPFGRGWDLFGTASRSVDLTLLSPQAIWYVQVAAIVIGHVAGVVLSHDLALRLFPPREAVRTQYALLAVMVTFTAVGLLILSGG